MAVLEAPKTEVLANHSKNMKWTKRASKKSTTVTRLILISLDRKKIQRLHKSLFESLKDNGRPKKIAFAICHCHCLLLARMKDGTYLLFVNR